MILNVPTLKKNICVVIKHFFSFFDVAVRGFDFYGIDSKPRTHAKLELLLFNVFLNFF